MTSEIQGNDEPQKKKAFWKRSLGEWATISTHWKEICGAILAIGAVLGIVYQVPRWISPEEPLFRITVVTGPFHIPSATKHWPIMTGTSDLLTGLHTDDAKQLRSTMRHYTVIDISNRGKKPFHNVQFQFPEDSYYLCNYWDQNNEFFFRTDSKPIKFGDLQGSQSVKILIWSEDELDSFSSPTLSHDDGSETIVIPPSRGMPADFREIVTAAFCLIILLLILLLVLFGFIAFMFLVIVRVFNLNLKFSKGKSPSPSDIIEKQRSQQIKDTGEIVD